MTANLKPLQSQVGGELSTVLVPAVSRPRKKCSVSPGTVYTGERQTERRGTSWEIVFHVKKGKTRHQQGGIPGQKSHPAPVSPVREIGQGKVTLPRGRSRIGGRVSADRQLGLEPWLGHCINCKSLSLSLLQFPRI